jgi:tetratricopeptide (TPR) repeat protein
MSKRKTSSSKHVSHVSRTRQGILFLSLPQIRVLGGATLIAIVVFSAYLPAINSGFIMDDDLLLTENPLIKASVGLQQFWCSTESQEFYPVTYNTFWIEWRLWEMNPAGYHVTNLILHIVESLLIWIILRKLYIPGAFLAAMLFAVHPVNVESVAWIAQRRNMMAMLFFLLAILWYIKANMHTARVGMAPARSRGEPWERDKTFSSFILHPSSFHFWYWLSLAAFSLAMLGKGSAAVLPVLLLGIVWWIRPLKKWDLTRTAPFFLIAALLTAANMWFQTHGSEVVIRTADFTDRILGAGAVIWFYLYKAILPINLAFVYPQWDIHAANPLWWLPLAAALTVTAALWLYVKKWSRPVLFCWGFFCVALVPVMGFTDVGFMRFSLVADHYQHIAIIGLIALAASFWSLWHRRTRKAARWPATAVAITAAGTLAFLTWRQSELYIDSIDLYRTTLQINPQCWLAENNLGTILFQKGRRQEAIECYHQAIRLNPGYADAHKNLGTALVKTGHFQEAIEPCEQALRLEPSDPDAHNNLGNALLHLGRLQEAIDHYQLAIKFKPDYTEAYFNMGDALKEAGQYQQAIEFYKKAIQIKPGFPEAWNNLGAALLQTGRFQEAIKCIEHALRLKSNYSEAHNNLANALLNMGRLQDAIEHYENALRLNPEYPQARYNLGNALVRAGRPKEAIEQFQEALRLKPDYTDVLVNLGITLMQTGRPDEAIEHFQQALRFKPDDLDAQNNLGVALIKTGRTQEAIEHYEQALRLNPDFIDAHNNLGNVLMSVGQYQQAIEHYRHALALNPNHIDAYFNSALAYAEMRQSSQAVDAAQKALELARSQGKTVLVRQIEDWLNSYRAGLSVHPDTPPPPKSVSPPP